MSFSVSDLKPDYSVSDLTPDKLSVSDLTPDKTGVSDLVPDIQSNIKPNTGATRSFDSEQKPFGFKETFVGGAETLGELGTAGLAFPAQLLSRIEGGPKRGAELAEKTAEKFTFKPRTEAGKAMSEVAFKPFEYLNKFENWLAEKARNNPEILASFANNPQTTDSVNKLVEAAKANPEQFGEVSEWATRVGFQTGILLTAPKATKAIKKKLTKQPKPWEVPQGEIERTSTGQPVVGQELITKESLDAQKITDYEDLRSVAVDAVNIKEKPNFKDPNQRIEAGIGRKLAGVQSKNIESIARDLDRPSGNESGANKKMLYDDVNEGYGTSLDYKYDTKEFMKERLPENIDRMTESLHKKKATRKAVDHHEYILESGETLKITPAHRISIALHKFRPENMRHILDGGFRYKDKLYKITANDIKRISDDVWRNPDEKMVAEAVYENFNLRQKELLNKTSQELDGTDVAPVKDYFPSVVDGLDIPKNYIGGEKGLPARSFSKSVEGVGSLKKTVNSKLPIILEDVFDVVTKSTQQAGEYIGLSKPLRQVKTLLNDPVWVDAVKERYGKHYIDRLNEQYKAIEDYTGNTDMVERVAGDLINKIDPAILGLNPWVIAKQPVSLMGVLNEIEFTHFANGLKKAPASYDQMGKYSGKLRHRAQGNVTREMGEVMGQGQTRSMFSDKTSLGQKVLGGIKWGDRQAVGRIWNMAESELTANRPELAGEAKQKAIALRAEELVRLTQPTFDMLDRSGIATSKTGLVRLATKYSSQRNKNYQMIARSVDRYRKSNKGIDASKKLAKDMVVNAVVMPSMIMAINEARNQLYGYDKNKDTSEDATVSKQAKRQLSEYTKTMGGNVYFVSDLVNGVARRLEKGTTFGVGSENVLERLSSLGIDGLANAGLGIEELVNQEVDSEVAKIGGFEFNKKLLKSADQLLELSLSLKGVPYRTLKKAVTVPQEITKRPEF